MTHFLDKHFDKLLLTVLFVIVFGSWVYFGIGEIRDISRDLVIALVALCSGARRGPQTTNEITTETVTTPSVNTDTISNSTVNTESLNVENQKKETEIE